MSNPDFQNNPPLILVVDDEKTFRLVVQRAMEKEGYRVAEAYDGKHCLEICQQQPPDIVLLDAMMPAMDGFACCAKMRATLGDDCPPVLMITSLNDKESIQRAFEIGATDYITKPIDWEVLRQRIHRLLAYKGAQKELQHKIQRECQLTVQMEASNRDLQRLASFDSLTKLANRRYFDEYLQREWKRLEKVQLPLSLILCEIDFFQTYNDSYGHQAGDECLCQVANTINKCKRRSTDIIARYGAEEFAIVLPKTDAEGAFEVAQTIRASVKALHILHAASKVSEFVTLSLGVASLIPCPKFSVSHLITIADSSLHQAKQEGRDSVVILSV
ncbi:response regulator [Mastigocladopsis repens]|uniref:response regulator n=1 Tax=Mastigocladopsis repens TaxID=221287 RepID=UPI0002F66A3B|nr:PleD family two-component system response regulator [Mastigocladopsis repens]